MAARRGSGLPAWRLDVAAGGLAGLLAGLVVGWLEAAQGMMAGGLAAVPATAPGWGVFLAFAILVGVGFGAVFGYQPGGHAATLGAGLVAGLLSWVLGPLTLLPLLAGQAPTWSLAAATAAFPHLVGALLYGGLTGVGLHLVAAAWLAARPPPAAPVTASRRSPTAPPWSVASSDAGRPLACTRSVTGAWRAAGCCPSTRAPSITSGQAQGEQATRLGAEPFPGTACWRGSRTTA